MARLRIAFAVLLLLLSVGAAQAQNANTAGLLVYNAWVRPTAPAPADGATPEPPIPNTVAGAYLTIQNTSSEDYQLVGIASSLAEMSMLHQTTVDSKGIARMRMVMALDVPAGQTVTFTPGDYHVMLMNIVRDVYPGDAVPLTLTFADQDGKTFDMMVAALGLDSPPEDDPLIAANAIAQPDPIEENALDVSLVLNNRSDQVEMLTGVVSTEGSAALLTYLPGPRVSPYTSVEIAAQGQTPLIAPDGIFVRLSNLTRKSADAFALTLTFESGKSLTIAVPVVGAAS